MQKFLEATGENRDAAVANALKQLGLERDDVSVEVLEIGKKGFLGIGATPARVRVTYEAPDIPEAKPEVKHEERKPAPKAEPKQAKPAPKAEKPAEKPKAAAPAAKAPAKPEAPKASPKPSAPAPAVSHAPVTPAAPKPASAPKRTIVLDDDKY